MRKLVLVVGLAWALYGCGTSDQPAEAGADALCRDWCTCEGQSNPSCLDDCVREVLMPCGEIYAEYRECVVEMECSDPFEDCGSPNSVEGERLGCFNLVETMCNARCPAVGILCRQSGDCGVAEQCEEGCWDPRACALAGGACPPMP